MADVGLVALIIVFFILARGYVAACARLIGAGRKAEPAPEERGTAIMPAPATPPADLLTVFPLAAVGAENWIALVVAALVLVYLVVALLRPERF